VSIEVCPTCGRPLPQKGSDPTARELDVLAAWWRTKSVKKAAVQVGVGEQRAKNLLARCRSRSGVKTNADLLHVHLEALQARMENGTSHNIPRREAA
jgi:hypothetical protein